MFIPDSSHTDYSDWSYLFPAHKCGMHLGHNEHKNIYETAEQWIGDNTWCDWENEEAKQRDIEIDEIWTLQWYPNTPVGFYALAAPTRPELLAYVMRAQITH